jgi:hypothetical protein
VQWNRVTACVGFVDAASCKANEARYKCRWIGIGSGNLEYCSTAGYSCDPAGSETPLCKFSAERATSWRACADLDTNSVGSEALCNADQACEWVGSPYNTCEVSLYGELLIYKKLGSKVREARYTQETVCNKLTTKQACLAEPLPAGTPGRASANSPPPSPSSSPARSSALALVPATMCAAAALLWVAAMAVMGI